MDLEAVMRELLVAYRNDIIRSHHSGKFVTRIKEVMKEFDLEYGLIEPADIETVRQWME